VPYLDELKAVTGSIESTDKAIDAVAGVPENAFHAPSGKPFPNKIAYCLGHLIASPHQVN
jgi:hypothetical protein